MQVLLAELVDAGLDFFVGQLEPLRRPVVEPLGQLTHRIIAAFGDVSDQALDDVADFVLFVLPDFESLCFLEPSGHGGRFP